MEITEELRREIDVTGAALLEQAEREPYPLRLRDGATVEALMGGEWKDLTGYVKSPRITKRAARLVPGPRTVERRLAYRVRVAELPQRLELTDGTGNLMVNICRSASWQSEMDRVRRSIQGRGRKHMHHPNRRLAWYGIRAGLAWEQEDVELAGGTARQRACYRRAVERFLTDPAQIGWADR